MKKSLFLAALFCACCCITSPSGASELKIGFVDIQKAVSDSIAGKNASEKFKDDIKKAEEGLLKEKSEVEKIGEMLEKQSAMLTDEVRRDKEKDYLRRKRDYERLVKDQQTELQIKESELKNEIMENLIPVIQKYGKENSFSIVFGKNESGLLYAAESFDLTDKIVALYDGEQKNKPAKSEKTKK